MRSRPGSEKRQELSDRLSVRLAGQRVGGVGGRRGGVRFFDLFFAKVRRERAGGGGGGREGGRD